MDVWTLVINNAEGLQCHGSYNPADVDAKLLDYVQERWTTRYKSRAIPDDPEAAIEAYFNRHQNEQYARFRLPLTDLSLEGQSTLTN